MKQYTEQEVKDAAFQIGMDEEMADTFFHHYNSQGWLKGNGLPITNLSSQLVLWRNTQHLHKKAGEKKVTLWPIGGNCCKCKMPAVYESTGGDYNSKYCQEHMPKEVRQLYA